VVIEFLVGLLVLVAGIAGLFGLAWIIKTVWNKATQPHPERKEAELGTTVLGIVCFVFVGGYAILVAIAIGDRILG